VSENIVAVSPRVAEFSWDQFTGRPALDRILLKKEFP
jgi:hypothetical protein